MIDNCSRKLYLSKDIHLDSYGLAQHQIDAIRFLFRQFKLKKLGVIINDPPRYGKTIEVLLFLNAIKASLTKPILVLCDENATEKWKHRFLDKTDFLNGGGVKTKVIIGTTSKLAEHKRTEWSIMVIDADTVDWELITNSKNRTIFNVDYKIWLTADDMKNNLQTFSKIYHWMYPKRKFDSETFTPKTNRPMEIVSKAIRLDAFLQDIVIRGRNFVPLETSETNITKTVKPKPTLKNKDSTGTKIKRSKRKLNEDNIQTDTDIANECSALKITKGNVTSKGNEEIIENEYEEPTVKAVEISDQTGTECVESDITRRDLPTPKSSNEDMKFADSNSSDVQYVCYKGRIREEVTIDSDTTSRDGSVISRFQTNAKPNSNDAKFIRKAREIDDSSQIGNNKDVEMIEFDDSKTISVGIKDSFPEKNKTSSQLDDICSDKLEQMLSTTNTKDAFNVSKLEGSDPKTTKKVDHNVTDDEVHFDIEIGGDSKPCAIDDQKDLEDTIDNKVSKKSTENLNINISQKIEISQNSVNNNERLIKETAGKVINNKSIDDIESKLEKLGEEMLKKYKGSLLDSLF